MSELNITVGATETASKVIEGVGSSAVRTERVIVQSMSSTEDSFDTAARGASTLGAALDKTQGFADGVAGGIDGVGAASQAVSDIMSHSARKAEDLARAQIDVEQAASDAAQAIEDMNQANRDAAQAGIDAEQAAIDQKQALVDESTAQKAYNEAVKEFGANSDEAKQAALDINQALLDGKQAKEDAAQAERDLAQSGIDAKQAMIDQKEATTNLTASQRELESQSSVLGKITDWAGMLSGVLSGLVGIIGAVTAVQWLWNIAMTANPIGLIIAAIALLIGIIILIATKTTWFQTLWKNIWGKIGDPVKATWAWIKKTTSTFINWISGVFKDLPKKIGNAFKSLARIITAPYRAAFRGIAAAWNNTVGRLSFTIPSWVPGIGGAGFSMPKIPSLAVGGDVLKSGLAMIHAGERITPAAKAQRLPSGGGHSEPTAMDIRVILEFPIPTNPWEAVMVETIKKSVKVKAVMDNHIRDTVKGTGNGSVQTAYGR